MNGMRHPAQELNFTHPRPAPWDPKQCWEDTIRATFLSNKNPLPLSSALFGGAGRKGPEKVKLVVEGRGRFRGPLLIFFSPTPLFFSFSTTLVRNGDSNC